MQFPSTQSSYAAGEISPSLSRRVDLAKYKVGLQLQRDFFTLVGGGSVNRPGTQFVAEVKDSSKQGRLIRFKYSTGDTYVLEFGDLVMRVFRNGALVESSPGVPYELTTTYALADLPDLKFNQSFDVVIITHRDYVPRELRRTGHANWTLTDQAFAPQTAPPSSGYCNGSAPGASSYAYAITAVNDDTGEESLQLTVTVAGVAPLGTGTVELGGAGGGGSQYNIYRYFNGVYGFIGRSAPGAAFTDNNIAPDTSITPPSSRDPLTAVDARPGCSSFWKQRSWYAQSWNGPQTINGSVAGAIKNFSVSQPTQDDDAIARTLDSKELNSIKNIVSLDDLLLATSGGIWRGTAGGQAVTPASLEFTQQTYSPVSDLIPLVIGEDVLFTHELGAFVSRVSFEAVSTRWRPADLSVLSRHLLQGYSITEWAYAEVPFNLVWCVRSDGKLLSFTYLKEQEVYAWALHDIGGVVESICSVPENGEDTPYMIVRRTIDGATVRYVEKFHTRQFANLADAWFVDCALRYSGAPATVISGLDHLEGEDVVALADGVVVRGKTVTGGSITLDAAASVVTVGLGYAPVMRTCGVEAQPTLQGKERTAKLVTLALLQSRGGEIGPGLDLMTPVRYNEALGNPGSDTELFTGDVREPLENSWDDGGAIYIRQPDPLPMSVLSHTLDMSVG